MAIRRGRRPLTWRNPDQGLRRSVAYYRSAAYTKYTAETDKRILAVLDGPVPAGYVRWTGPLIAAALGDVDVQYVWRFLRAHKIDLSARKSWCESNDPDFTAKAAEPIQSIT
jgi:hypothetical protein